MVGGNQSPPVGSGGAGEEQGGGVRRLITRLFSGPNSCLPYLLPLDTDGTAACKVFTTSAEAPSCACDAPNRAPVSNAVRDAVLTEAKSVELCDQPQGPACSELCVCENLEAMGDGLASCLSEQETSSDGWCYVSPGQGIGELTNDCQGSLPRATIRFRGEANVGEEVLPRCCERPPP